MVQTFHSYTKYVVHFHFCTNLFSCHLIMNEQLFLKCNLHCSLNSSTTLLYLRLSEYLSVHIMQTEKTLVMAVRRGPTLYSDNSGCHFGK